jgi:hypothetical protein
MMSKYHPFDALAYLEDRGIEVREKGQNVSREWIGINCPFCGDEKFHCGINRISKKYSCWRCGSKGGPVKFVMTIEGLSYDQAKAVVRDYASDEIPEEKEVKNLPKIELDPQFRPVTPEWNPEIIEEYFKVRKFTSELYLTKKPYWTGLTGYLNYRVAIPVFMDGLFVNWVARSLVGKKPNYYSCPNEKSVMNLKHCLYGYDRVPLGADLVVVEGVFDQWRIGQFAHCVASFGTVLTPEQAILLRWKRPRRVIFLYDSDVTDQKTEHVVKQLWWIEPAIFTLAEGDPADLPDSLAKTILRDIMKNWGSTPSRNDKKMN